MIVIPVPLIAARSQFLHPYTSPSMKVSRAFLATLIVKYTEEESTSAVVLAMAGLLSDNRLHAIQSLWVRAKREINEVKGRTWAFEHLICNAKTTKDRNRDLERISY